MILLLSLNIFIRLPQYFTERCFFYFFILILLFWLIFFIYFGENPNCLIQIQKILGFFSIVGYFLSFRIVFDAFNRILLIFITFDCWTNFIKLPFIEELTF